MYYLNESGERVYTLKVCATRGSDREFTPQTYAEVDGPPRTRLELDAEDAPRRETE